MIDHRPINGNGACARCGGSLDLASQKLGDVWYCSSACAQGRTSTERAQPSVPEPWLYARPRRYFAARKPKELRATAAGTRREARPALTAGDPGRRRS